MRELAVHLHGVLAGHLREDERGRLSFQYAPAWLADPARPLLSLALPRRPEPFDDPATRPFFANLLPDDTVRRRLAQALGLSESNDFALLDAVGGDCAGAISLLPAGTAAARVGAYQVITPAALAELLQALPERPLLADLDGTYRLSLAGAQYKLPVFIDAEDRAHLPRGDHASSHILKPPNRDFADLVENEYFCMRLAARAGLPVAAAALREVGFRVYQVTRYDRAPANPSPRRLHQEDFCQALGLMPDRKYEAEGGPTLVRCFQLLDEVSVQPAVDRLALLRWTVFNLLVGNADSHAKNLALLLEGGPRLAPFYDLVSTAVIPGLSKRLAMRIGGVDEWIKVHGARWTRFAKDAGLSPRLVLDEAARLAEVLPGEARALAEETAGEYPSPVYGVIADEVARRSAGLLRGLQS